MDGEKEFERFARELQTWMRQAGWSGRIGYFTVMVGADWLEEATAMGDTPPDPTVGVATNLPEVVGLALMAKVVAEYAQDHTKKVRMPPTNGGGRFDD